MDEIPRQPSTYLTEALPLDQKWQIEIMEEDLENQKIPAFDIPNIIQVINNKQNQVEGSPDLQDIQSAGDIILDSPLPEEDPKVIIMGTHESTKVLEIKFGDFFEKHSIENLTSETDRERYYLSKFRILQFYHGALGAVMMINYYQRNLQSQEKRNNMESIDWARLAMIIMHSLMQMLSVLKDNKYIVWCFLPMQIFVLISLSAEKGTIYLKDESQRSFHTLVVIVFLQMGLMNSYLISEITQKFKIIQLTISGVVFYGLFFRRLFGSLGGFPFISILIIIGAASFVVTLKFLNILEQNLFLAISRQQSNLLSSLDSLKEFEALYQNIDLGIIVAKNQTIEYANDFFKNFMKDFIVEYSDKKTLQEEVFTFFKKSTPTAANDQSSDSSQNEIKYSLSDLILKSPDFLEQNYFKISCGDTFKYVQLKIKSVIHKCAEHESKLIQLVDISDKILYTEAKAEHTFLEMINAAVSHELRNPLNSLIGQACSMSQYFANFRQIISDLKNVSLSHKLVTIYDGLERCNDKMSSACKFIDFFVHDILDYTILNKDTVNFIKDYKNFDLNIAIDEIKQILEDKSILKNIQVFTHFEGFESNIIKTDKKRMQQVLLNLMSNALKFTDRNGKILVLVENLRHQIRISVKDTGIGIKKKDQNRLFRMFESIKDEQKKINVHGVGLGLVICKLIVNKFDGHIDFVSKHKQGSTFFFTFDAEQADNYTLERQESSSQEDFLPRAMTLKEDHISLFKTFQSLSHYQALSHNRILCVDDEEFCIASMTAILYKLGIDVENSVDFCINGLEAIEMAQNSKKYGIKYRLILTDFNMPMCDGVDATKKIRQILGDAPKIVGVTGYATTKYHKIGQEAGMNEVIAKPVYIHRLREVIKKYYHQTI